MNINDLVAKDVMKKRVETIDQKEDIIAAARMMHEHGVSSLVIRPSGISDTWGIVTRKDIVNSFLESSNYISSLLVEDIMSKPALIVASMLSISHCLELMKMVGIRRLPVVDGEVLVGILSNTDIFNMIAKHLD